MTGFPMPATSGEKAAAGLLVGIPAVLAVLGMWQVALAMAALAAAAAGILVVARVLMDAAGAARSEGGGDGDA